jgi:hypothetical protein
LYSRTSWRSGQNWSYAPSFQGTSWKRQWRGTKNRRWWWWSWGQTKVGIIDVLRHQLASITLTQVNTSKIIYLHLNGLNQDRY